MAFGIYETEIALPEHSITTEKILQHLNSRLSDSLQETLHKLCIDQRYSIVNNYDEYLAGKRERHLLDTATSLGEKAVTGLLEKTQIDCSDIGLFIAITNTPDRPMPCIAYEIMANNRSLPRDLCVLNLQGQGCSASLKAIEIARLYLNAHPEKHVLMVISETPTGYTHPLLEKNYKSLHEIQGDPGELRKTQELISHFLFGDGAVAFLLNNHMDNHIIFEDIIHLTNIASSDKELLVMNEGGIRTPAHDGFPYYLMMKDVPQKGMEYSGYLVEQIRNLIQKKGISTDANPICFIHTGSKKIIDGVCSILEIPNPIEDARFSYSILRNYANLSAASVGMMIHEYLEDHKTSTRNELSKNSSNHGVMISFGVGFSASAAFMRFK